MWGSKRIKFHFGQRKGERLMVEIKEKPVPNKYYSLDPRRFKTHQHSNTDWDMEGKKVPIMDSITIKGKIGGIHILLQELAEFSCEAKVQIRIKNGSYQLSGHINVFRRNMLDIIEHLLHEIDLLAFAIAHGFNHKFEIDFTCEQTIEFSLAA